MFCVDGTASSSGLGDAHGNLPKISTPGPKLLGNQSQPYEDSV